MPHPHPRPPAPVRTTLSVALALLLGLVVAPATAADAQPSSGAPASHRPSPPPDEAVEVKLDAGVQSADGPTVDAKAQSLIFADGFESGDLSAWLGGGAACTSILQVPASLRD